MKGEVVKVVSQSQCPKPGTGHAGLKTQVYGAIASVSNLAASTGGIRSGGLVETD